MSIHDHFGWRDRAIALASLGAATLSRLAFTTADVIDEKPLQPLEMQVLVALALQDSLVASPRHRTGTDWLSLAPRLEPWSSRPVAVTELGLKTVEGWLKRTRRHFGGWPPERPGVDDAVG